MGTIVLAACATQQPLVHDDVDRLFLKYAEIAQRPSPITADEAAEVAQITDRVRKSGDVCLALKFLKLFPVTPLVGAGTSAVIPVAATDLQAKKNEAKQYLQGLQKASARNDCPYSGVPPVEIK
ncbi:MAG TPA: hypothetical protein VND94_08610 [Terriglobia bacterium]|nr:hypothetical protein [Terriglobia bacterium]